MPNMYKQDLSEWLINISNGMVNVALDKTDDIKALMFINGMRFMGNEIAKHIWAIVTDETTWYSMLTRTPIKKWKVVKK